jgi:hypothetical protein
VKRKPTAKVNKITPLVTLINKKLKAQYLNETLNLIICIADFLNQGTL